MQIFDMFMNNKHSFYHKLISHMTNYSCIKIKRNPSFNGISRCTYLVSTKWFVSLSGVFSNSTTWKSQPLTSPPVTKVSINAILMILPVKRVPQPYSLFFSAWMKDCHLQQSISSTWHVLQSNTTSPPSSAHQLILPSQK